MKYYWTTKEGKKVDVDEMSTEHLRNAIKMILRTIERNKSTKEIKLNGEASNAFNDDMELSELEDELDAMNYDVKLEYFYK